MDDENAQIAAIDAQTSEYDATRLEDQLELLVTKKGLHLADGDSLGAARTQLTIGSYLAKRFFDKNDASAREIVPLPEAQRSEYRRRALSELQIAFGELRDANDFGGANLAAEMIKRLRRPGRHSIGI